MPCSPAARRSTPAAPASTTLARRWAPISAAFQGRRARLATSAHSNSRIRYSPTISIRARDTPAARRARGSTHAAVDADDLAVDVTRSLRTQERDQRGDFRRHPGAAGRNELADLLLAE